MGSVRRAPAEAVVPQQRLCSQPWKAGTALSAPAPIQTEQNSWFFTALLRSFFLSFLSSAIPGTRRSLAGLG